MSLCVLSCVSLFMCVCVCVKERTRVDIYMREGVSDLMRVCV